MRAEPALRRVLAVQQARHSLRGVSRAAEPGGCGPAALYLKSSPPRLQAPKTYHKPRPAEPGISTRTEVTNESRHYLAAHSLWSDRTWYVVHQQGWIAGETWETILAGIGTLFAMRQKIHEVELWGRHTFMRREWIFQAGDLARVVKRSRPTAFARDFGAPRWCFRFCKILAWSRSNS